MKLLLIDDHALFREGVAALVEQRMPGVALHLAGDLNAARSVLAAHPDCRLALLDLGLPDSHGLDGIARLRELAPALPIVVLSADDRPETVLGAIDRGAAGFIPKSADSAAFAGALREVLDGRVHLPRQALLGADTAQADDGEALGLSPRQVDVLRLLVEGRSNKMIMRELDLSESTVKTHLQAIFRRLGVSSRTQAVVAAARLGLQLA
ncbi:MAG TPA: response regulator transcription factor [Piscinibacter sp.]|uniref:LuxR C-terminal-related transcriptional regulator n=1 Tax=Piscinibacter sp. TaxID=1903157 RepID=UPI0011D416C5|nr:response regulator transcription factor [Piscinibacter sp.]MBP5989473.1 response regulator transcription factor [Piscinibacter sp.]MBP6027266.1 response regulator transcription factor [Piscinibacter sp.]TXH46527.1 MAG: response regulator transcription factor [Burkholderiaceae bacterium]HNK17914.1 response regulator transcription factor [Piscinibacter sp.]